MPVSTPHPDYSENYALWKQCRCVINGSKAVKEAGIIYLPRLEDMTDKDYAEYVLRATFYGATGRTKDGLHGYIFRKDPTEKIPSNLENQTEDVDLASTDLYDYAKNIVGEILEVGRAGTLIDWSDEESRPYAVTYKAEDIINWRMRRIYGKMRLALLVLREIVPVAVTAPNPEPAPGESAANPMPASAIDEFVEQCEEQYRVFRLIDDTQGGIFVRCEIWTGKREQTSSADVMTTSFIPSRRGQTLAEIPFVFHNVKSSLPDVEKPPLADVAEINLSHYRTSADIENARHYIGSPTVWVAGFDKDTVAKLGSRIAWVSSNPNAKAQFLEFEGKGLDELRTAMTEKETQMAALGARLLEAQKPAVESAETLQMRQSGESSALTNIANSCTNSLTKMLKWFAWWIGTDESPDTIQTVGYTLNTDFVSNRLTYQDIQGLVLLLQSGSMSPETMHENLQRGEIIDSETTYDEEQEKISTNPPVLPGLTDPNADTGTPPKSTPAKKKKTAPAAA